MESDVGISEFVSDLPELGCVLKERYQDFIVREITLDGTVVRLTKLDAVEDKNDSETSSNSTELPDFLSAETRTALQELCSEKDHHKSVDIPSEVTCHVALFSCDKRLLLQALDKAQRTLLHESIRKHFSGQLNSSTKTINGIQIISVTKAKGKNER